MADAVSAQGHQIEVRSWWSIFARRKVKILLVHNYYRQPGGEDVAFENEGALLEAKGHEVQRVTASNPVEANLWGALRVVWELPYSRRAKAELTVTIERSRPDVMHVHNFFPLMTPSVYDAADEAGVAVIQTLHNFRLACAAALLMRDGKICEECLHGSAYTAVKYGCYRQSRLGTLAVARMIESHRKGGIWREKVDRFIALTEFARGKFIEAGLPAERIVVKPNFWAARGEVNIPATRIRKSPATALFVGRVSREKGIHTLLSAWNRLDVPLRVVGDGPLGAEVRGRRLAQIHMAGRVSPEEVSVEMSRAAFLVIPSEWYEGFPMVLVEAYAHGLPVIASRIGSLGELITDGVTGLHFEPGSAKDLAEKVRWAANHPDQMCDMGENARRRYSEMYSSEPNYRRLMQIYGEAIHSRDQDF